MTWEPGMIAVCVEGWRNVLIVGNKYVVKDCGDESKRKPCGHWPMSGSGSWISLVGISDDGPTHTNGSTCWRASRFRPLDDGDIQGLREKYGEPVGKKEGVE